MKKQNLLFISLLLVIFFTSCQKQPEANFKISKTNALTGDTIKFTNSTINGDHYKWDFGDNSESNDVDPTHCYKKDGTFNVVLTAYSKKDKKTATKEQSIIIEKANEIEYNGKKYPLSKAYLDVWGDYNGNYDYYNFNLILVSEGITITEDDVIGIGNIITASMWSPSATNIVPGTYTFASNYAAMSYNYGLIGLNYNVATNIGTSFTCSAGTVVAEQDGTDYIFDMNYTLATGQTVKAYYKGTLIIYNHTNKINFKDNGIRNFNKTNPKN